MAGKIESAIFGSGCFWCTEAVFDNLKGVQSVKPGYAGGTVAEPTYEAVCSGTTGHAEAAKIDFDPGQISYAELLNVFFATHDPTTLNRQGNDIGSQYRSIILYASAEQKRAAEQAIKELTADKTFDKPIVTEVKPLDKFYEAEAYHHQYYKNNFNQPYCQFVISPKLAKLRQKFSNKLKDQN